jgi:hypothetical protein
MPPDIVGGLPEDTMKALLAQTPALLLARNRCPSSRNPRRTVRPVRYRPKREEAFLRRIPRRLIHYALFSPATPC